MAVDTQAVSSTGVKLYTEPITVGATTIHYPGSKIIIGTTGVDAGPVSSTNPLPVSFSTGAVTVSNASGASAVNIQDGGNSITVDGTVAVSGTVTVTGTSSVTVANASGASAVNIQDGGNTITVDGTVSGSSVVTQGSTTWNVQASQAGTWTVSGTSVVSGAVTVTGTATVTQGSTWTVGVSAVGGTVTVTGTSVVSASQSGTWTVQPGNTPNTTPWLVSERGPTNSTTFTNTTTVNAGVALASSGGRLHGVHAYNKGTAELYLKMYNTTAAPTTSDTIVYNALIPASSDGAGFIYNMPGGVPYSAGISYRLTAGSFAAGDTTAGTTAGDAAINIFFSS